MTEPADKGFGWVCSKDGHLYDDDLWDDVLKDDDLTDDPNGVGVEVGSGTTLAYRDKVALMLGDRSKYPDGRYPSELGNSPQVIGATAVLVRGKFDFKSIKGLRLFLYNSQTDEVIVGQEGVEHSSTAGDQRDGLPNTHAVLANLVGVTGRRFDRFAVRGVMGDGRVVVTSTADDTDAFKADMVEALLKRIVGAGAHKRTKIEMQDGDLYMSDGLDQVAARGGVTIDDVFNKTAEINWDDYASVGKPSVGIVPLSQLIATQDHLNQETVTYYVTQPDATAPDVTCVGKKLYVDDGHHRIAAAAFRGEDSVTANIQRKVKTRRREQVEHLSYRERLALIASPGERIDLPIVEDVSFPMVIGAIPVKPKRKKKTKKVLHDGVLLGRLPTEIEQRVLSLSAISRRYDLEVDQVVTALAEIRREHLMDDRDDQARERTALALAEAQTRMAKYGMFELRQECQRQGLALADCQEPFLAFVPTTELTASVTLTAETLHQEWLHTLARIAMSCRRTRRGRERAIVLAEGKVLWGLKGAAKQVLNEAFTAARRSYMPRVVAASTRATHLATVDEDEADELVDYVIQSAVMDVLTCDPCAAADGMIFDYDSDDMEEYAPPYAECLGGPACRCTQIYMLKDGSSWVVREDQIL